ncbi:BTAD domain-containing putative transcriptional regulator [Streptomyces sp. NPDC058326]|uniref:AfsR/SARP family transcriptional regulator n=1 Tax=Streptomyces sp. NPDC058326 TaxID=3346447 RepID=UPI0036E1306A
MEAPRGSDVHFNILGTLEVWHDSKRVRLGGTKSHGVLSALLLEANHVVPLPRLVEAAWERVPPATAEHQVRKVIADLRSRIPGGHQLLLTDGPGYRIALAEDQLDLSRFERALAEARDSEDAAARAAALETALGLFRGRVLPESRSPVLRAAATIIEDRHLSARERLLALRLEEGRAHDVVGELRALVTEHPFREALTAQLMVALYRVGRQADALRAYHVLRGRLADQLGIDPSSEVSERYQQILRNDPDLYNEPAAALVPSQPPADSVPLTAPRSLPHDLPDFTGRESEIDWLLRQACVRREQGVTVITIDGMGGTGKSTLAVHLAHRLAQHHPDGQIFVDLHGFTPGCEPLSPSAALGTLLRAIGVPAEQLPDDQADRESMWRGMTAGRRLLLLLDNAVTSRQVRPLIPNCTGSLILVTSRSPLLGLDGAVPMTLGPPTPADARLLLTNVIGADRVESEPEATAELVELCARLPLALRIAAARLRNRPQWAIASMVSRLRDESARLGELVADHRSVRAVLEMSCATMSPLHQRLFRLLGVHPGSDFDACTAAALGDLPLSTVRYLLEDLLDARLLVQRESGRFTFHGLVRSLARSQADQDRESAEPARRRLLDYYLSTAETAAMLVQPGREPLSVKVAHPPADMPFLPDVDAALAWFDAEHQNLLAVLVLAEESGLDLHVAHLPRVFAYYLHQRGHINDELAVLHRAVAAARRLGDEGLEGVALSNLAIPYWHLGRMQEGHECAQTALALAERSGDRLGTAFCLSRIGMFRNALGEYREARGILHRALVIFSQTGSLREVGAVLTSLGVAQTGLGDHEEARRTSQHVIANSREIGDPYGEIVGLTAEAGSCARLGDFETALTRLAQATRLAERIGTPNGKVAILSQYADVHARRGRYDEALRYGHAALDLLRTLNRPAVAAAVHNVLGLVHRRLDEYALGEEHHLQARRLAQRIGLRWELVQALEGIADARQRTGDAADANEHRGLARELRALMTAPAPEGCAGVP